MNDPQDTDLQQRAAAIFYYLASDIPAGVWRAADGIRHDMRDMSIEQLDRCVAFVRDDLEVMNFPICQDRYGDLLSKPAQAKLSELLSVREALFSPSPA